MEIMEVVKENSKQNRKRKGDNETDEIERRQQGRGKERMREM